MKLTDKLEGNKGDTVIEGIGLGAVLGLVALATFNLGARIKDICVKNNLEPNAIYARDGRAKVKNMDLDKNGKYESILYYNSANNLLEQSFLLQYDKEKGYPIIKPYKIEQDSLTNKKTIKILE